MVALLTLVLTQDSIMILFVLKAILSTLKKVYFADMQQEAAVLQFC